MDKKGGNLTATQVSFTVAESPSFITFKRYKVATDAGCFTGSLPLNAALSLETKWGESRGRIIVFPSHILKNSERMATNIPG